MQYMMMMEKTYHSSITNHAKIFYDRVLLNRLINLESVWEQAFAQMTTNCINFSHENAMEERKDRKRLRC